jgi:perosamine synthetase
MSSPDIEAADIEAVTEVLRSDRLALGPRMREFETRLAAYVGAGHAVAVSSGTAALHLIVKALEIGPGDEVLVPSFSFVATANAILYEGATPVFVEIEPEAYTISPEDLERKITPRTRAIMVVDVFGHPARWDAIQAVAAAHGLDVIDDACEALGAEYAGARLGRLGRAAAFAFYPNKQLTTGEGGMIVTDDAELAARARSLRNQGRAETGAYLEHERLGYNYRMSELQAALGVSQLARIEKLLARRAHVAELYDELLRGVPRIRTPQVAPNVRISWFVYVVTLEPGLERDDVMRELEARGVPVRAYFPPIHRQPYIRNRLGAEPESLPLTESVAGRTLALPFHGKMERAEVELVARVLREVLDMRGPEAR